MPNVGYTNHLFGTQKEKEARRNSKGRWLFKKLSSKFLDGTRFSTDMVLEKTAVIIFII